MASVLSGLPKLPDLNPPDCASVHSDLSRDRRDGHYRKQLAYFLDIGRAEFSIGVPLASRAISSLLNHVSLVRDVVALKQVSGITAGRVVAMVKHENVARITERQRICEAVGAIRLLGSIGSSKCEQAVAILVSAAKPRPALVRSRLSNAGPKLFYLFLRELRNWFRLDLSHLISFADRWSGLLGVDSIARPVFTTINQLGAVRA